MQDHTAVSAIHIYALPIVSPVGGASDLEATLAMFDDLRGTSPVGCKRREAARHGLHNSQTKGFKQGGLYEDSTRVCDAPEPVWKVGSERYGGKRSESERVTVSMLC